MTNPGSWLRELREELHLTRMGVERLTAESASRASNERYRIRRGRLADIEDGHSAPDIFEVASLSECYKVPYPEVLRAFGVMSAEPQGALEHISEFGISTQQWSFRDADRPFSLAFHTKSIFDATRLVTESPEELGIPAAVRLDLDAADHRLGIIGLNDDTMGELVPAGSVVVIDKSHTTVETGDWKSIRERPIYFVWHENGYSCSWCSLVRETLFVVPYPTSRQPVMIFKTPRAATIIGQVIHVWAPLVTHKRVV
ncbi:MAG TPA: helix-turn-helix transcriptional regulator [Candidatus Sulfotelmatobacter sp.]|nr:helix-turn-helix transcriptional regulator [Candidatus Sulfotelmatobacter sp.]